MDPEYDGPLADFMMDAQGRVVPVSPQVLPVARRVNFAGNAPDPRRWRAEQHVQHHTAQRVPVEQYGIQVIEGEAVVGSKSRQEVIRARMEQLEAELTELDQFGEDEYEDGAVLVFDMSFRTTGSVEEPAPYVYAAIKAKGLWFVTGQHNMSYWRWDQLVNFWKGKCTKIMLLKADREVFSRNGKHAEVTSD
jgi:hypothetical protein